MAKLRVAVLFGGVSSEHEVSCISAAAVADNLNIEKYDVLKIGITNKGRWLLYPGSTAAMRDGTWHENPDCAPAFISPDRPTHGIVTSHDATFDVIKIDVAFPVLHGRNGEDGTIQGLLELAGIPFVGCGVTASACCMDKAVANQIFAAAGVPHTPWMAAHRSEVDDFDNLLFRLRERLHFPIFVKPSVGGSSVGVSLAENPEELRVSMQLASAHDTTILFEQAVEGLEVECAVMGNDVLFATPPGEIESANSEMYDYEAKYHSGDASRLYLPARLPEEKLEEVRQMALKAYRALGCQGYARTDFFVEHKTGRVLVSEVNTIPGFTPSSMFPKLMERYGIPFPELVDRLVQLGLERAEA